MLSERDPGADPRELLRMDQEHVSTDAEASAEQEMTLFDLRVTVDEIRGRSVCGMRVGDWFEVRNSDQLSLPPGRHFCFWAIQSVLPLLPAKMRKLPDSDWLEQDSLVCCPDPEEGLVMRIERVGQVTMKTSDLS